MKRICIVVNTFLKELLDSIVVMTVLFVAKSLSFKDEVNYSYSVCGTMKVFAVKSGKNNIKF